MPEYTTDKALYHDVKRETVYAVAPGEEVPGEAAFLIAAAGTVVSEADARHFGLHEHVAEAAGVDLLKAQKELLQKAIDRGALEEAAARRQAIATMEMAPDVVKAAETQRTAVVGAPIAPLGDRDPNSNLPASQPHSGRAGERGTTGGRAAAPRRAAAPAESAGGEEK